MPYEQDTEDTDALDESSRKARVLDEAKKRFKLCEDAEKKPRTQGLDDLRFRAGEQWPQEIRNQREAQKKPCLTINILPSRERQILNDQRQNEKSIKVSPVDSEADPETAEVLQGVIRHIEYESNAKAAWDTARAFQVRVGFGFVRVVTEYEDPNSFNQVLKIKRIPNPFLVYMDPSCQEPDYSDADYGFIFETLTKEDYKAQFPKGELASLEQWNSVGDRDADWISDEGIRICEYFYRELKTETLVKLSNGQVALKSQLPPRMLKKLKIVAERETEIPTIRWCKFNQKEILDETDWQGKWIPIVPVLGDELNVDGQRILEGMVRHAKEAVRMNNYMASAMVQAIGIAPDSPWVMAEGQDAGHEKEWQNANRLLLSRLIYKPVSVGGTPVPAPQRITSEPPIQAIAEARSMFGQDIKDITGIYDAQLGAKSNEVSGTAIGARKLQGELSNLHFADNESTARRHVGRILIDLIPKIYSQARVMRTIGEDGTAKTVQINQQFNDGGVQRIYDFTVGRYDVTVSDGPSYETKRQETSDSMLDLVKSYPELMQLAGDMIVRNLDFPGAEALADRIKKTLPPELQDNDQAPEAQLAAYQSKLKVLMQQHEQLTAVVQKQNEVIQQKQIEASSRIESEKIRSETQITVAEISTKAQQLSERLEFVGDMLKQFHEQAHERALQAEAASQSQDAASQQAAQQAAQSSQDAAQQQAAAE